MAAAPRFMRMIAEMDIGVKYPVLVVGNRSATTTLRVPLGPYGVLVRALGGPRRGGIRDLEVRMAMRVKALREQHQGGQKQRQKRCRADVERDDQGDGHVPWPPNLRLGDGRALNRGGAEGGARPRWRRNLSQASSESENRLITDIPRQGVRAADRIRERNRRMGNAEIRL